MPPVHRSLPAIGPVLGRLPAPCAAAALSSLTGRSVRECQRVLARNHGRCPLDSAVTPAILTSLEDLGFAHALEVFDPAPAFGRWAAAAAPGAYLVVVPAHVVAAAVLAASAGAAVRVADNGEVAAPVPAPPTGALAALPVHETIRCAPNPRRR